MSTLFKQAPQMSRSRAVSQCYIRGTMIALMGTPLGDRIRAHRKQQGLTQGQLATFARVKRSWLSLVEAGERERPNAEMLARVADTLGVSVEYLVSGRTDQPDPEKEAILRRLSRYPSDFLARIELMAGAFFSEDDPRKHEPDANTDQQRGE